MYIATTRALIIDDELTDAALLSNTLKTRGFDVSVARNAFEAHTHLQDNPPPDVAIIDYVLAGGPSGFAVAKQFRAMLPHCVIVMTSLYAQREDIADAVGADLDGFLIKPIDPRELIQRIDEALLRRDGLTPLKTPVREVGRLWIHLTTRKATWHGAELKLTRFEYDLLVHLTANPNKVLSYTRLYAMCRGVYIEPTEARERIKTHLGNLRKKLLAIDPEHNPLVNVYSAGFMWKVEE